MVLLPITKAYALRQKFAKNGLFAHCESLAVVVCAVQEVAVKEYTENYAEPVDEIFGAEECLHCDKPYTSLRRINGEIRCENCFDEKIEEKKSDER